MELILKKAISSLGFEGDVVNVKPGYGRNYLLPQGKAVHATPENLALLEKDKAAIEARRAENLKHAENTAKKITGLTIVIEQLAGADERLFGSVTTADICAKLAEINVTLDKKQLLLNEPIKTLGETKIQVKVGFGVTAEFTLTVVPIKAS
jgi:large subunit ribosomal protein L9